MSDKTTVKERLTAVETEVKNLIKKVDVIFIKIDKIAPNKVFTMFINILLLGVFVWLGALTFFRIGG